MTTRRHFIALAPAAGLLLLAACSKTPEPAPAIAAPAAPPAPATPAPPAAPATPAAPPPAASPAGAASAGSAPVDEKDPQAQALGYVADATRVDPAAHKTYVAGSQCGNCAQYQGKAGDAAGPCTIFQGKQVAARGWCSAFAKKA